MKAKKIFSVRTMPYWLISPVCLLLCTLLVYPILRVFFYSFFRYSTIYSAEPQFVWFENYSKLLFQDRIFKTALPTSLRWVITEVILQLLVGGCAALILNQSFRGRSLARTAVLIPWAVSGVLTAILWSLIFNEHIGLLNDLLIRLGIMSRKMAWLGDFSLVFGSVVTAELWRGIPFFTISLLADMQSIPPELYEAAKIDGANYFNQVRYLILPHLKDTILLTTLLRAVWEFNNVDVIYNLTAGGPANRTMTLSMYISSVATKNGDFGFGSTISVICFLILTLFAIFYLKLGKFSENR